MHQVLSALVPLEWEALYANGICGWYKYINFPETMVGEYEVHPGAVGSNVWPVYCDLFALRHRENKQFKGFPRFYPGLCNMTHPRAVFEDHCEYLNNEAVIAVRAAFGGLAFYRPQVFRPPYSCRYDEEGFCEHLGLSECIHQNNGTQLIATRLVVNWEGCDGDVVDFIPQVWPKD
jgi:hypothetical protein